MRTIDTHELEQSESLRWVTAYANHVLKRFNSRAIVSVRHCGETIRLSQVYALKDGGLVLVEHEEDGHHEHGGGGHHEHGGGGHHEHGGGYECPRELWVTSREQVVLEACPAADGEWCTGFGYLGRSRTPHVLVARGTDPPPRREHDH